MASLQKLGPAFSMSSARIFKTLLISFVRWTGQDPVNRIGSILFVALLFYSTLLPAQTASPPMAGPSRGRIRHVIIVSVDGLMPAVYVSPDAYGLQLPTLREMARNGAWSQGARSVFPSVTYPSHTSIATGTNPLTHGIFSNIAFDPLGKNNGGWRWYTEDIQAPTLWDAARARGLTTALVSWPVTVGARATAVVPEIWRAGTEDDVKLIRALATPGILEAVEKRFPRFRAGYTPPRVKDESLTDIAVHLIETLRPNLLMLHIFQVDNEQHAGGPFSARAIAAIENAERQIDRVITAAKNAGIWRETVLLVVSDHGFAPISRRVRVGVLLAQKGLVTLNPRNRVSDWKASVASNGGHAYVYLKDPNDTATSKTLLDILLPLAGKPASGIRRIYRQDEIRAKGGNPSAFLALEAAEGFTIGEGYTGEYLSASPFAGTHGYDPDRPEMWASLLVYGPSIAPGKIESAKLIDVAPTVAHWLDLKMEKAEGTPLQIQLRASPESLINR
ncbi:MAG: alkaline phosphatase family protein [Deltaproteobacteria bacterium]|nr:alkaline phosphatase family protein [Deltaproteobacteria bacterium]